jgi:hypothetical protein
VDLASYASLAVRLVNTAASPAGSDALACPETFRTLVADMPQLAGPVTAGDLASLRLLRGDLRQVFSAAARQDELAAVHLLNALLARHPIHSELTRHDGQRWHMHLVTSGSAADRYAAGAVAGLTGIISSYGLGRLHVCAAAGCDRVFLGTGAGPRGRYCSQACSPPASVRPIHPAVSSRRRQAAAAS